ncbi:MAG: type II toxin-antitoxin system VapB family antitoxin [Fibrobacterota bacterium]|nr:MAG: type II toxin-antitoxin system VapB family antitoxin [Fibrobacterota bacterium]
MPSRIAIDDDLLEEAFLVGQLTTREETVHLALKEYILKRKQFRILSLAGAIDFDEVYDYKSGRNRHANPGFPQQH